MRFADWFELAPSVSLVVLVYEIPSLKNSLILSAIPGEPALSLLGGWEGERVGFIIVRSLSVASSLGQRRLYHEGEEPTVVFHTITHPTCTFHHIRWNNRLPPVINFFFQPT